MFRKIKDYLFPQQISKPFHKKTLKELDSFDTVWVLDVDGSLLEGWVYDITRKHILVVIPIGLGKFIDVRFSIKKPLSQTELTENNKTLFLNKPCVSEMLSTFQSKKDL